MLQTVWGGSRENVVMGSVDGKVIQFDGRAWKARVLYPGLSINDFGGDATRTFAIGNTWKGALDDSVICFMRTGDAWAVVNAQIRAQNFSQPTFGSVALYSPASGIHYSCGYMGVFQWLGENWIKVFSPIASLNGMAGSSSTNMLAVGSDASGPTAYHCDGSVWNEIKLPSGLIPNDVAFYGVWMTANEAFIVGNNGSVSYVVHGS